MKYIWKKDYNPEKEDTWLDVVIGSACIIGIVVALYLLSFVLADLLG